MFPDYIPWPLPRFSEQGFCSVMASLALDWLNQLQQGFGFFRKRQLFSGLLKILA